jgi:hypothetical protein
MKMLLAALLAIVTLPALPLVAETPKEKAPAAKPADAKQRDGSSVEKAIVVASVDAEYQWLKKKYPGHKVNRQALLLKEKKPYDMLSITTKDGKTLDVYFDISSFFGK